MKTIAEQIADRLNNDATRWETKDGVSLCDIVHGCDGRMTTDGRTTKHIFDDGSSIIAADGGWDLGILGSDPKCFCFASLGCECGKI